MTRTSSVRSAISRSHSTGSILSRTGVLLAKAALVAATLGSVGLSAPSADAQVATEHVQELRGRYTRWDYAGTFIVDDSSYRISTRGSLIDQVANALIENGYDVRFVNGWLRVYKDFGGPHLSWSDGANGLIVLSRRNYYSLAFSQLGYGRGYDRGYDRDNREDHDRGHRTGGGFHGRFDAGGAGIEIGIGVNESTSTRGSVLNTRPESTKSFRSGAGEVTAQSTLPEDENDVNDHGTAGFKSTREQSGGRTSTGGGKGGVSDNRRDVGTDKTLPIMDTNKRNDESSKVSRGEAGAGGSKRDSGKKDAGAGSKLPINTVPEKIIVKETDTVKNRTGVEKGVVAKPLPVPQPIVTMPSVQPAKRPATGSGKGQINAEDRSGSRNSKAK